MKALIRVANKKSNIKFNQLGAYRALSISDVNAILSNYTDIDMLIFEETQREEIEEVKAIASRFTGNVYTFGCIKLAGIDNFVCLSDMQDAIDKSFGLETKTYRNIKEPVLYDTVYDESGNVYVEPVEEPVKVAEPLVEEPSEVSGATDNIKVTEETTGDLHDIFENVFGSLDNKEIETSTDSTDSTDITDSATSSPVDDLFKEVIGDISGDILAITQPSAETTSEPADMIENEPSGAQVTDINAGLSTEEPASTEGVEAVLTDMFANEPVETGVVETAQTETTVAEEATKAEQEPVDMFGLEETKVEEAVAEETVKETTIEETASEPVDMFADNTDSVTASKSDTGFKFSLTKKLELEEIAKSEIAESTDNLKTASEPVSAEAKESKSSGLSLAKAEETASNSANTASTSQALKPLTADELEALKLEPVLDIRKLNSFNSLVEESQDLVSTLFSEICYYRDAISKLSSSDYVSFGKVQAAEPVTVTVVDEETTKELEAKKTEVTTLQQQLAAIKAQYEKATSDKTVLTTKLTEAQTLLNRAKTEAANKLIALQKEATAKKESLEKELANVNAQLNSLKTQNSSALSSSAADKDKINSLGLQIKSLYDNYIFVLEVMTALSERYNQLTVRYTTETAKLKMTTDSYQKVLKEKVELETQLTDIQLQQRVESNKSAEAERLNNLKMSEFSKMQENLQKQLQDAHSHETELKLEIDSLNMRIESADKQKQAALQQVDGLLAQISEKNTLIDSTEAMLQQTRRELEQLQADKSDSMELKEQVQVADLASKELQKEIGRLQIENKNLQDEIAGKNRQIGDFTKMNSELKVKLQAMSKSISNGSAVDFPCRYSGHGFVIPIFGSGSYGVTTTAASLARKLHEDGNSVLLMDMDIVSPKCNEPFKLKPLLPETVGQMAGLTNREDKMAHTCFGILLKKGTDYFIHNRQSFIQNLSIHKKTRKMFDYFGGLYIPIQASAFAFINWEELMNVFGNQYDYIVADCGRFGGSNEQNSIISMFVQMSLRYLAITPKNDNDIRLLLTKIRTFKFNEQKLVWMINMCTDSRPTDLMLKAFGQTIPYRMIEFNRNMFGNSSLFTDAVFRGQFMGVVDDLVK